MPYIASTVDCIIVAEENLPLEPDRKNKTFHCVRYCAHNTVSTGIIVAILPLVGSDELQRSRAVTMADALNEAINPFGG